MNAACRSQIGFYSAFQNRNLKVITKEMKDWMEANEYESVKQMQGSMCQLKNANPTAFERAQYMKALSTYKL